MTHKPRRRCANLNSNSTAREPPTDATDTVAPVDTAPPSNADDSASRQTVMSSVAEYIELTHNGKRARVPRLMFMTTRRIKEDIDPLDISQQPVHPFGVLSFITAGTPVVVDPTKKNEPGNIGFLKYSSTHQSHMYAMNRFEQLQQHWILNTKDALSVYAHSNPNVDMCVPLPADYQMHRPHVWYPLVTSDWWELSRHNMPACMTAVHELVAKQTQRYRMQQKINKDDEKQRIQDVQTDHLNEDKYVMGKDNSSDAYIRCRVQRANLLMHANQAKMTIQNACDLALKELIIIEEMHAIWPIARMLFNKRIRGLMSTENIKTFAREIESSEPVWRQCAQKNIDSPSIVETIMRLNIRDNKGNGTLMGDAREEDILFCTPLRCMGETLMDFIDEKLVEINRVISTVPAAERVKFLENYMVQQPGSNG